MLRTRLVLFFVLLIACFLPARASTLLTTASTTCTTTSCASIIVPADVGTVAVQIDNHVFSGAVQFEGSADGGTTFAAMTDITGSDTSATAAGLWQFNAAGLTNFRVRCSTHTSGAIGVSITKSKASPGAGGGGGGGVSTTVQQGSPPWSVTCVGCEGLAATDYGTTGAPSAHILTVQGNASGIPQPVSLPTATVSTLTPPAAITGYATSANQINGAHSAQMIEGVANGTPVPVSGTVTVSGTATVTTNADTSAGTTASSKFFTIGGKTNDGTPQYQMLPLGAAGRSVIIEGYGGGTAVPISGSVTTSGTATVNVISGFATDTHLTNPQATRAGILPTTFVGFVGSDYGTSCTGSTACAQTPRIDSNGGIYTQGMVASGAADAGNPHKIGGVFNTTQPTVTNGQRVDAQMTSRGATIVASGIEGLLIKTGDGTGTANDATHPIYVVPPGADPCDTSTVTGIPINQTGNTQLVALSGSTKIYICDVLVVTPDAESLNFVEGTGSVCGTGTAGVTGGSTAATGMAFSANGGFVLGNGGRTVMSTATAGDALCLFQTGSGQVSGRIRYVQK